MNKECRSVLLVVQPLTVTRSPTELYHCLADEMEKIDDVLFFRVVLMFKPRLAHLPRYPLASRVQFPKCQVSKRPYSTRPQATSATTTGLLALGFIVAAAGAYYYETRTATYSGYDSTFSVRIRNKDHTYSRKSDAELEQILTQNEDGQMVGRRGNPVIRWDRNWVGSNEPCEDRSAVDIIPRSRGVTDAMGNNKRIEGDRDIGLFSIFDGHAGDATSKLLARVLHPTVALELADLQATVMAKGSSTFNPLNWFTTKKFWDRSSVTGSIVNA